MSPAERFEKNTSRIERFNPRLGAFIHLRLEEAQAEAEASATRHASGNPLSPIDGWCIGAKANIAVKGMPHHAGIAAYRDVIAKDDAELIKRLKEAGVVILGILNMHEGALGATTDNVAFGRTQNPWREGYTPGGSSGGSGAAVAAGLCDVALGSDTMGSVRIPSAYCGCYGHKPTTGLVSNDGVLALSHTLDHVGPHARSVEELGAVLNVLGGKAQAGDELLLSQLRIGVWDGAGNVELQASVKQGFGMAIQAIESAGAELSRVEPPAYEYGKARRAGLLISEVEGHAIHEDMLAKHPDGFSDTYRKLLEWGVRQPDEKIAAAFELVETIHRAASGVFDGVDFIIAPTAPQTAFPFTEDAPANQADFTAWANFARLPATAIYTGQSEDGLPLSLQVIGTEGADAETLSAARALQKLFGSAPTPTSFA